MATNVAGGLPPQTQTMARAKRFVVPALRRGYLLKLHPGNQSPESYYYCTAMPYPRIQRDPHRTGLHYSYQISKATIHTGVQPQCGSVTVHGRSPTPFDPVGSSVRLPVV